MSLLQHTSDLLTQSASQVRRLFETRFPGVKIPSRSSCRLKNSVYKINPCTLEELKRNIRDEINNINRGELQRVMGNFIKRCQKCMDNKGGQFQLLSTTICKIVTEMKHRLNSGNACYYALQGLL